MSTDINSLKLGDVFYSVGSKAIPSKSQHETREIDGEIWYKYNETKIKQHVIEYKVLGILRKELEGEWKYSRDEGDLQTQYYVRYMDDTHMGNRIIDFYGGTTKYFVDKQDALDYISSMEKEK